MAPGALATRRFPILARSTAWGFLAKKGAVFPYLFKNVNNPSENVSRHAVFGRGGAIWRGPENLAWASCQGLQGATALKTAAPSKLAPKFVLGRKKSELGSWGRGPRPLPGACKTFRAWMVNPGGGEKKTRDVGGWGPLISKTLIWGAFAKKTLVWPRRNKKPKAPKKKAEFL